jgi:hypothetical protein
MQIVVHCSRQDHVSRPRSTRDSGLIVGGLAASSRPSPNAAPESVAPPSAPRRPRRVAPEAILETNASPGAAALQGPRLVTVERQPAGGRRSILRDLCCRTGVPAASRTASVCFRAVRCSPRRSAGADNRASRLAASVSPPARLYTSIVVSSRRHGTSADPSAPSHALIVVSSRRPGDLSRPRSTASPPRAGRNRSAPRTANRLDASEVDPEVVCATHRRVDK